MNFNKLLFYTAMGMLLSSCALLNRMNEAWKKEKTEVVRMDTLHQQRQDTSKNKLKPYKDIIGSGAITNQGLLTVHQVGTHYFWEVPDTLLGRDILIVRRITQAAAEIRPMDGSVGYAGDQIASPVVVRFSKGPQNKLFIKTISYGERATDSTENGLLASLRRSSLPPIAEVFDIKAYTPDSLASVIEVTDWLKGDNGLLGFAAVLKGEYKLSGLQADKSYIESMQVFPANLEIRTVKTYTSGDQTATYELNASLLLLSEQPMKPRQFDERVGYFFQRYTDFDAPQGTKQTAMITRWRLEPKEADIPRYLRGELVEPKKPIVFYIDPTTPKKWVPYLIQGVNDWQKALEKAGFKNAIYALEAPKNDTNWSLFDARHSAIVYNPSTLPNAMGPVNVDPRTGEILEAHVCWYHDVMKILHDWYLIQTGPNDARARKMIFDDSLMGQLIRFVSSHEVGHTLGLTHNFGASSTVPTDSLRSLIYLEQHGHCPSIMDYARFNYVAQPEDSIPPYLLMPCIGDYDKWAIEWGYRWFPPFKDEDAEQTYLKQWVTIKLNEGKQYWFGEQPLSSAIGLPYTPDPRRQSEDLGDDAMEANTYGIRNLQRVMANLYDWTNRPGIGYADLKRMTVQVQQQYVRYIWQVANNISATYFTPKTTSDSGNYVSFASKAVQQKAIHFLNKQLFQAPTWLMDTLVFSKIGGAGPFLLAQVQQQIFEDLISFDSYSTYLFAQMQPRKNGYSFDELLADLKAAIWTELKTGHPIEYYRRQLQMLYLSRLKFVATTAPPPRGNVNAFREYEGMLASGYYAAITVHMRELLADVRQSLSKFKDSASRQHLLMVQDFLKLALNPEATSPLTGDKNAQGSSSTGLQFDWKKNEGTSGDINQCIDDCWKQLLGDPFRIKNIRP